MMARKLTARQKLYAEVVAIYGLACHLCGHEDGGAIAMRLALDHLVLASNGGSNEAVNLRPAHYSRRPCEICSLHCNEIRGQADVAHGRAKVLARIAGTASAPRRGSLLASPQAAQSAGVRICNQRCQHAPGMPLAGVPHGNGRCW
jgi:hypothetical protein